MIFTCCAPCLLGLEGLVADEFRDMKLLNVRAENGKVLFDGDISALARANINSRYSERIMILLSSFRAKSFDELFDGVFSIPWEEYIPKNGEFPVTGSSLSSALHSVPDCQSIIKKAVVERLGKKYGIKWFEEDGASYRIRFLIMKDNVSIMLDTTGIPLHKRGYRKNSGEAPIKETLAAAMAKFSRVRSDANFIDPLCGSGTILIEAAYIAMNIAPGINRQFAGESWQNIDVRPWQLERERARQLERRNVAFAAHGFDIDPEAVELTLANAKKAGVAQKISAQVRDISNFSDSSPHGCVVTNPPYGERMLDIKKSEALYALMGERFTPRHGWNYSIISADEDFEYAFGRKADKRRKLYNGMLKCQLYMYYR